VRGKVIIAVSMLLLIAVARSAQAQDTQDLVTELTHKKALRRVKAEGLLRDYVVRREPSVRAALPEIVAVYRRRPAPHDREGTVALLQLMFDHGYDLQTTIAELVDFLETDDTRLLCDLTLLQGCIGPDAQAAVPRLKELLADSDVFRQTRAASALARIDGDNPAYIDALLKGLAAEKEHDRWLAADGLGRVGPRATRTEPALTVALQDPAATVRTFAAIALWRITKQATPSLPTLIRAIDESGVQISIKPLNSFSAWDFSHSMIAVGALGAMKQDALIALERLLNRYDRPPQEAETPSGLFPKQYDSDDQILRGCILRAMNHVAPADPRVTERTKSALEHPQPYVRSTAKSIVATQEAEAAVLGSLPIVQLQD